ncbi:MAG: Tat pathway signal protein, partial [Alphaproteobacteria bacterium]
MHRRTLLALTLVLFAPPLDSAKEAEPKDKAGASPYVELQTLNATTVRANGSRGVVTVDNCLNVPDPALRTLATESQPRLRAAYNAFLSQYMIGLAPGAPPNADLLATQFQRITDRTLG